MTPIEADFNARTESGHVRLTPRCSQESIEQMGTQPGDWVWLTDGELIVGALVSIDPYYGVVGIPHWDTLVHLDDLEGYEFGPMKDELDPLLSEEARSTEDEARIFKLLTQLEFADVRPSNKIAPNSFAERRAFALRKMEKLGLALVEIKDARQSRPNDPEVIYAYIELLGSDDLTAAVAEVQSITKGSNLSPLVLSACINILAKFAERVSDDDFRSVDEQVLALGGRLDEAPDLGEAEPSIVALAYFNRGLFHLRAGRHDLARQAFDNAQKRFPFGPMLAELSSIRTYDRHACEAAERVRADIAERFLATPVAA